MIALRPVSPRASLPLGWALILAVVAGTAPAPARAQATRPVTPPAAKEKAKKAEKEAAKAEPIDLNSATAEELMTLPGVGEATARKIIDARPHKSVEDLAAVGVPARRVEEIKPLAVVRPLPVAVDLNNDPLLRIETLPGVGPALAREVVAARPFAGFEDLAKVKGFGPAKVDSLRGRVKFGKGEPAAKSKAAETKAEKAEAKAEKAEPRAESTRTRVESKAAEPREARQPGAKVNLNTASLEELDALPGIGPVRAQDIVAGRPYAKIEDVMKVKGIKEVEFGKIKDMISVAR